MEAKQMIKRIPRIIARACWAIGDGINSIGDRINLIGVKRAPPSDSHQIFSATLQAHSEKIVTGAIKKNALIDDKTVGGIDRRPSWWRR
jgi:uncharacterized protein with PhoU and TrkA domain